MAECFLSVAVQNEQDAVNRLRTFLVDTVGWTVAQDVTNTATDRDVVFQSSGELGTENLFTRYIRLRGTSDAIYLYTYETFTSVSENTGEVSDATYGLLTIEPDAQGVALIAVADLERLVLHAETYDGTRYLAYVGRITSYYHTQQHNYPNLVKGCQSETYDWYYDTEERNAWMTGPEGSQKHYVAIEPLNGVGLTAGQTSDRTGELSVAAPVLVHDGDVSNSELVGEPRGLYRIPTGIVRHFSFVSLYGRLYVVLESNDKTWAAGPITSAGIEVPELLTDLTG
jgi:hypothetical protein